MADEMQHRHRMEHSLNADTPDLDDAKATYVIDYSHSHDGGELAHSHAHQASVEPSPDPAPKAKKSGIWWGDTELI